MAIIPNDQADVRRGIDHIGVSATFIIHDGHGQILLHKRGPGTRDEQGNWDNGGGAIEFGESLTEAIRREVKEEFQADALDVRFLTAYDAHRTLSDGTPTHWIALVHTVLVNPTQVKNGEPHKIAEFGWFTSNRLPTPLHSQFWKSYQPALDRGIVK